MNIYKFMAIFFIFIAFNIGFFSPIADMKLIELLFNWVTWFSSFIGVGIGFIFSYYISQTKEYKKSILKK